MRWVVLPPRKRDALLRGSALGAGSLVTLGAIVSRPAEKWYFGAPGLAFTALGGLFLLSPDMAAAAPICTTVNAWVCTSSGGSNNTPEATLTPTADGFTVAIGQNGSADTYTDTGGFSASNAAALVIANTNNKSGTITETQASTLTSTQADGLRFYDTSGSATPTITFNIYGTLYGGNLAASNNTPEVGDGFHIGQTGLHAGPSESEATIGTLNINVGKTNVTDAVIRGADDGLYIAQNVTTQVTITNYGTINGKGMNTSSGAPDGTNWGEGVHISNIDKGVGSGYQISGAATLMNYGVIAGHANTNPSDADGPGSGVNISADGTIIVGNYTSNYSSNGSGKITGTDGVVAYGGGTDGAGNISLTNYGHIGGSAGDGANLSNANDISAANHSLGSIVGTTTGQEISSSNTASYDNRGGLTAGLAGFGLEIYNLNGVTTDPPQYAVTVNNTAESGSGGIIVGYQSGVAIFGIGNRVSYAAGYNGVLVDNSGGESGEPGGLIASVGDDNGLEVNSVYASDVFIDNSNTRNGGVNNLTTAAIDIAVGYDGLSTDTTPQGTTLLDHVVHGTDSPFTYDLSYVLDQPLAPQAPVGGISTGIWGNQNGVLDQFVGGTLTIDNVNGQIFGKGTDGIQISTIGGAIAIPVENTVSIDNSAGGLIEGAQAGVHIDTVQHGGVLFNNQQGTTLGGNVGLEVSDVDASVGIENQLGMLGGFNADGLDLGTVGGNVGIWNGDAPGGSTIFGGESGIASRDVSGTFYLDNIGGSVVGLSEDGALIDGVGGKGAESGDALVVSNSGGVIGGLWSGIDVANVYGNGNEGDGTHVNLDNRQGLVVGLTEDGVVVDGVVSNDSGGLSGSLTLSNTDTRHALFDLSNFGPVVYDSEGGGLLAGFGGESGIVSGGIFGANHGVYGVEIGGGVAIGNEDGIIVGSLGSGIDLSLVGGPVSILNGQSSEGAGGEIFGGQSGVQAAELSQTFYLDNTYGQVAGFGGSGVDVSNVMGIGSYPYAAVGIDNGGGVIAGTSGGVTVDTVSGDTGEGGAGDVFIGNSAGLIVGVGGDGVSITHVATSDSGGESGNVTVDNHDSFNRTIDLATLDPRLHDSEAGALLDGFAFTAFGDFPGSESAIAGIYGLDNGVVLANIGNATSEGGNAVVENQNGLISGENGNGISLSAVYGQTEVFNGANSYTSGGFIYGGESGIDGSSLRTAYVSNNGGVIVGNGVDGISLRSVGTGADAAGDVVAIDNSSNRHSVGGVIVGATYGIDVENVGLSYGEGDNGVFIDNSGWNSGGHQHAGGLVVGVAGDAVHIAGTEGDVRIDNAFTRANGSLGLSSEEIGQAAASLVAPLSEAGDDFLAPASTGIWGLDGNGIRATAIAGSVVVENHSGSIVGTQDSGGSAVYLSGIGSGITGTRDAVYIDNSSVGAPGAAEGDWATYSLMTGGDYAVRLADISNGNVVFSNDLGLAYGDEMGFALNGLSGGSVAITNAAGIIEGHNGSSADFPARTYPADSYGAITIANVSSANGHGGSVLIQNGNEDHSEGGAIVAISTASAIWIGGNVRNVEIDNGTAWGSEGDLQGGIIIGSGTTLNPVIVLDTSTEADVLGNGFVFNEGIVASTNLYGFLDPDTSGSTGNVAPVYAGATTVANYVVSDGAADGISTGDFLTALGRMNNQNADFGSGGHLASDVAIAGDTGAVDVVNGERGLLFGQVDLTGWNSDGESGAVGNSLTNYNMWLTQGTNTLRGAEGTSSIHNEGLIQTAFGSEGGAATVFNVDDFYNDRPTGTPAYLSMLDGTVGDTNIVNGNFHGSSDESERGYSTLAVDVYLDANGGHGESDTLIINGQVSGTTGIIVNVAPDSPGGLNTDGILVAQVNSNGDLGTCADAHCKDGDTFYISPASQNYITVDGAGAIQHGAFAWYLQDGDPANQMNYDLVGDYMPTVYQTPALVAGAMAVFYDAANVVSDHLFGGHFKDSGQGGGGADLTGGSTDPNTRNSGIWGRASGSWSNQTASVVTGTGPTVSTAFNQNSYNLLAGADFSPNGEGTGARFGLYGGYANSGLAFDAYDATAKYEGGTVGGYAAYTSGGFYVDTQVNADLLNVTFTAPSIAPGFQVSTRATTVGVLADIGNRFTRGQAFVEPIVSFTYADTTLGDMSGGGATVSFSNGESLRAGVGARVGVSERDPAGYSELSVLAKLWNEFEGNNTATLSDGTPGGTDTVTVSNSGVFGEITGSATRLNASRTLSSFISGGADFKTDSTTWKANVGVRTAF